MFRFGGAQRLVGLDPGCATIKAVQVLIKKGQSPVIEWGMCQRWKDDLSEVYSRITNEIPFSKGVLASVALHNIQAIYRLIEVPEMDSMELQNAIKYEEEVYIPFDEQDRVVDYTIASHVNGKYMVALAGAKKSSVVEAVSPLIDAGIPLSSAEMSGLALAKLFAFMYGNTDLNNATVILLDVGCKTTIFVLISKGLPVIIREINLGGELFTEQLEDSFQISREEAEMIKCMPGGKEEQIEKMLDPLFYRLVEEIQVSMEYSGNMNVGGLVKVFLSGGGARCPGLRDYLSKHLRVGVEKWPISDFFKAGKSFSKDLVSSWEDMLPICLGVVLS